MTDFCYWQAKSQQDCIIIYVNLTVTTTIAFLIITLLRKGSKNFRRRVKGVYIMLSLWVVTNLTKDLYSLIVYHTQVKETGLTNSHSQTFAILDTIPAIIIQTMFLAIPYRMWKNVVVLFIKRSLLLRIEEHELLNFLTFYLVARWIILFLPWLALILVSSSNASEANFAKLSLQLIDSLICNFLLFLSLNSFLRLFQQIELDQPSDKRKLKWQYLLMVICSSLRFLIDLGYLIVLPQLGSSVCIGPFQTHLYFSIGYTLIGTLSMHFVPVALVLYIYKPTQ